ncbi:Uma2 family endonuclease [Alienimonas chondri]|uniref:Putative restriction endonuclease domain-containing protein n=1 Tax=Alienimonas chondri TaxID=2681879 RepID=A0ABX1VCT2_9PLAN|nr:Uma2 family endonuclease [Alienimonas chondri]NNJ25766.1 hypothetical protein [Alienimonas chondri]
MNAVLSPTVIDPPLWPDDLDPDAPPPVLPLMTRDEYLAFDRSALELRYEWIEGKVRLMSGGTRNHGRTSSNFARLLGNLFADRPLTVVSQGTRTHVPDGAYYYPDVVVEPTEPPIVAGLEDSITAALLIIEVLSPSTARTDRVEKRREYLRIPTLENYLIVQPNVREIVRLTRNGDRWGEKSFHDEEIDLPRFDVALPMDAIYEDCTPGERID